MFVFILKLIIMLNFLITGYMWFGLPIVIDMRWLDRFKVAGVSLGPFILINLEYAQPGTYKYQVTLKHEYCHYLQQCRITPLGISIYSAFNVIKNFLLTGPGHSYFFYYYESNCFESKAIKLQDDPTFHAPERYFHLQFK